MTISLPSLKTAASLAVLAVLLVGTVLLRCWNVADVFVDGKTFFVDADCYSRMTRVQRVLEHPGTVIHRHEFENWPEGTQPHTTAPFDYLTAGLVATVRWTGYPMLSLKSDYWRTPHDSLLETLKSWWRNIHLQRLYPDTQSALDLAGAWVSPLLGVMTAGFLWLWAGWSGRKYRVALLFFFAVSPILVHGTVLGRPDHQSLLMFCLAVALGAEAILLERPSRGWAIAGGLAWGLGLWVSLYEPLILLVVALLLVAAIRQEALLVRERLWEGAAMAGVLLLATLVDGWHISAPDPVVLAYFTNWSRKIGELAHVPIVEFGRGNSRYWTDSGLSQWSGWLLLPAPLILLWLGWKKQDRAAWFWLVMLLVVSALTCWQARWGYFFALVFAMALPSLLSISPKRWIALVLFAVSLWPIAVAWDVRLDPKNAPRRAEQRQDNIDLYNVAQTLRGPVRLPVLAPWWQSPALAYWSGQPCVAGSSHESLPGTVDASRFYLTDDVNAAEAILARRKVACVVVYDADRVNAVSSQILGKPSPEATMGGVLYARPNSPPPFLKPVYINGSFRVFLRPDGLEP